MTEPDTKAIRAKAKMWHLPAGIADDILALCDAYEYSRLAVAHANDHADTAISDMQELRAEIERLRAAIDAWRTAFWVMDGHAVAIHDADGKCYSVRAHDYIVMHDLHRAALAQKGGE